jgi:hypothetical protein
VLSPWRSVGLESTATRDDSWRLRDLSTWAARSVAIGTIGVGFGWFLERLLNNLKSYQAAHGSDHWVPMARQALRAVVDFNEQRGYRPTVPEMLTAARSARRPLNHIVVFHEHTKAPSTPTGTR